jgi:hypothetical protein
LTKTSSYVDVKDSASYRTFTGEAEKHSKFRSCITKS